MINEHEAYARRRKVRTLCDYIDSIIGQGAHDSPDAVERFLAGLTREQWTELARDAKCRAPTFRNGVSETVKQILKTYAWRAEKLRRSNPRPVVGAAIGRDGVR